jgi:polysaccharide chain length determinant protein (PEP-CTERM system associated)
VSSNDGFTISFVHNDPAKAQQVATRLSTLFIEETIKAREQQVEGAVDFLVNQVTSSRQELDQKDEALRRYKQAHMGRLPEQLQTNLATMGMLQRELQTVEESLLFARERQESLLRGAARSASTPGEAAPAGANDLSELRRQLAGLSGRYTDDHPDVQRLRSRIARLEAREAAQSAQGSSAPVVDVASREQMERANLETKRLEDKRSDLEHRIAGLRANVEDTPRTEQELSTLTRDYQKLNENYTALLSKQLEAQMAGRVEQRWKGDRFRMLDPANLPEKPYFPRPALILALGAFLGLLVGLAASMAAEYLDSTIKLPQDLETAQPYPVLAAMPHLSSLAGSARR